MAEPLAKLKQAGAKLAAHKRAVLLLLLLLFLAFAAGSGYGRYLAPPGLTESPANTELENRGATAPAAAVPETAAPAAALLAVDIKGAVAAPGLYWLAEGSRVNDALALAGLLPEADTDLLNLAARLNDGQQLVVPYLSLDEDLRQQRFSGLAAQSGEATANGLINLNQAGLTELTALPGIGQVKGQAIITYREQQGGFTSV